MTKPPEEWKVNLMRWYSIITIGVLTVLVVRYVYDAAMFLFWKVPP